MKIRGLASLLVLVAVLAVVPDLGAQEPEARALLQEIARDYERGSAEPDVSFVHESGEIVRGVRCTTRMPTEFERWLNDSAVAEARRSGDFVARSVDVVIPIVFHVMRRKNGRFDVTDEEIQDQIDVLNDSFAGTGYTFELQQIQRHSKNRFATKCDRSGVERKFKKKYAVDVETTLNVYSCRPGGGTLGYAYLPSDLPEDDLRHGVVILYSSMPGGSSAPYNEGDTLVHEVGHYMGLYHTFDPEPNGCRAPGDSVADTPFEREPGYGCPVNRDSCPGPGTDPVLNFMDYSDDDCMEEFSPDQITRIDDQLATFKPTLIGDDS